MSETPPANCRTNKEEQKLPLFFSETAGPEKEKEDASIIFVRLGRKEEEKKKGRKV